MIKSFSISQMEKDKKLKKLKTCKSQEKPKESIVQAETPKTMLTDQIIQDLLTLGR